MKKINLKKFGYDLADNITKFVGSWPFIIIQSVILTIWVYLNSTHHVEFDPYPFILLNLFLSFQAAYATPMILMSSNRQAESDRKKSIKDSQIEKDTNSLVKESYLILDKMNKSLEQHENYNKELKEVKEILKKLIENDTHKKV